MSDLLGPSSGNGRTANGGSRAAPATGPVPTGGGGGAAAATAAPSTMRTPREIMQSRQEREARRQAEANARAAEERQRAQAHVNEQQQEERRRSAEQRRTAAGVAGAAAPPPPPPLPPTIRDQTRLPTTTTGAAPSAGAGSGYMPTSTATAADGGPVNPPVPPQPPEYGSVPGARPRATQQSQPQPRPAPANQAQTGSSAPTTSRVQPSISRPRQPSTTAAGHVGATSGATAAMPSSHAHARSTGGVPASAPSEVGPSSISGHSRNPTNSSFRHAFQRWEDLSSHWEGLTSYWIRRLEQNTEEVRREPLAQQMSRQITDLSAAGANLFHAVVELQRLRASSERKFQRWFFETRQEQERAQEIQMELERSLAAERAARQEAQSNIDRAERDKKNAEKMVVEMRRELQISKEEARRAWEELGRREQEERDRTLALREGQPTLIGGVQVVPMAGGVSRRGSVSHRPQTADSSYTADTRGGLPEHSYRYEEGESPTNTDPFMEGRSGRHDSDLPSHSRGAYSSYPSGSTPATSGSTTRTAIPASEAPAPLQPHRTPTVQSPNASQPSIQPQPQPASIYPYHHQDTFLHGGAAADNQRPLTEFDDQSYVHSEGDDRTEDWEFDPQGQRYRTVRSEASDDYDIRDDMERERLHSQTYTSSYSAPSETTTAGPASPSGQGYHYGEGDPADYSGDGYGSEWPPSQRHHYPTRLSDVLEEDERSRTSPSRASQASRGLY